MSSSADAPQPRAPGPSVVLAVLVMLVAAAIGITGLVIGVSSAIHRVTHFADGPRGQVPAEFTTDLTPATWQVYVARLPGGATATRVRPSDVQVTDPAGAAVPVRDLPGNLTEEIDIGGRSYLAAARFDVPHGGAYRVSIRAEPGSAGTPVLVARSLGSDLSGLVKWFAMAGLGFLLGCVGLTMLIVGIVRRRSAHRYSGGYGSMDYPGRYLPTRTGPPAGGPPAGWYDDPHLPEMQRYWDGSRWTDHTRNTS